MRPLRVLLADDSPLFFRWVETELSHETLTIVGRAQNGADACAMVERLAPDLVLMDVHMPVMGGLDAVAAIMARRPTPIVMVTGDPRGEEGALAFEALRRGARDLIPKPSRWRLGPAERVAWRRKLHALAGRGGATRSAPPPARPPRTDAARPAEVIGVGASTGGPAALAAFLGGLPSTLSVPVLVVQHLAPGFVDGLARWLARDTRLEVRVAVDGERPSAGDVLIAPDGAHLSWPGARVRIEPARGGHVPSIDVLFGSLARSRGAAALGVLLTGMGTDGVEGMAALHEAGALTLAQDAESSVVWGIPGAAAARGVVAELGPPASLARLAARATRRVA